MLGCDRSCPTVCSLVILVGLLLTQGVYGLSQIHECPRQPFIPIYLSGMGITTMLLSASSKCGKVVFEIFSILYVLFIICWFIVGNLYIFLIYHRENVLNEDYFEDSENFYCNETLYWFAFWSTISIYALLSVVCLTRCCCPKEEADHDVTPLQV